MLAKNLPIAGGLPVVGPLVDQAIGIADLDFSFEHCIPEVHVGDGPE